MSPATTSGQTFDHHSAAFAADSEEQWRRARACPVLHSDAHGGFYVAARYDDVARVAHEDDNFSSALDVGDLGNGFGGITIPPHPGGVRSIPIEIDPPELLEYRRLVNRYFSPHVIEEWTPRIREIADEFIDAALDRRDFDIMRDLAGPIPAMVIIEMLGLPRDGHDLWTHVFRAINYLLPGDEGFDEMVAGLEAVTADLRTHVEDRRRAPRDDLITVLAGLELGGSLLTVDEVVAMCTIILGGGIDTTTALIGHAMVHLDADRALRQRLVDDPTLIPAACEEYLRWVTPIQCHARTATGDVELGGQPLHRGDRVLLSWRGANWDDSVFDHPEAVDIDRSPNRHVAFGLGAHRCLGSTLARAEFCITMGQVLSRMPDYAVLHDRVRRYANIGTINGLLAASATAGV